MTEIIDNWLDKNLVDCLEINFLYERSHLFGHTSNSDLEPFKNKFYKHDLDPNEFICKYLFYKLQKTLNKKLSLIRMYLNIQWPNMNSSFHPDDGDITALYMVTKTRKDKDGAFEIKGEEQIQFIQNRLICFDANKEHRGIAPSEGPRITLAFKTKIND